MNSITKIYETRKFAGLKKQLFLYEKIARDNYRGERTIIVLSGLNFNQMELEKTPYLSRYEEKFLFFLLSLRFSRTRVIYVTSRVLPEYLINYYLDIISDDDKEKKDMRRRLIVVNLNNLERKPVAYKLLKSSYAIRKIESYIFNYKTTYIRCYSSTDYEKRVALKLGVPLYGIDSKLIYYGTKSGSIHTFKKTKVPSIDGFIHLESKEKLIEAIARLTQKYPEQSKLIIKIEDFPAGEGNVIFSLDKLKNLNKGKLTSFTKIKKAVGDFLYKCCEQSEKLPHKKFSYYFSTIEKYFEQFERDGGIVELYLDAEEKYSPSCQVRILPNRNIKILSTHDQVLAGKFKTEFTGCYFPARKEYRREITNYAYRVAKYLAKKGVIGRFAVDFLAFRNNQKEKFKLFAIEINLRKGGTTHPYELTRSATGALYSRKTGLLSVGKNNIYYYASDNIRNKKWASKSPKKLIELIKNKDLNFNRITKRGVIIHLFSILREDGRFGATFIATSPKKVDKLYQKTLTILNKHLK